MSPEEEAERVREISRFLWSRQQVRPPGIRATNGTARSQEHPSTRQHVPATLLSRDEATPLPAGSITMADDQATVAPLRPRNHHSRRPEPESPAYDNDTLLVAQILTEMRGDSGESRLPTRSRSVEGQSRR